jgi:hypothetical protein
MERAESRSPSYAYHYVFLLFTRGMILFRPKCISILTVIMALGLEVATSPVYQYTYIMSATLIMHIHYPSSQHVLDTVLIQYDTLETSRLGPAGHQVASSKASASTRQAYCRDAPI